MKFELTSNDSFLSIKNKDTKHKHTITKLQH